MKLKLSILLTTLFAISGTVFGQEKTPAPKTVPNKPADVKTVEVKPADGKTTAAVKMPTAQEILAKYVQAIGGKANYEKLKTRLSKATQEIPAAGIKGTIEIYAAAPDKSFSKAVIPGLGDFTESFDGKTAWADNPIQGKRDKSGEELAQTRLVNSFYRDINLDKLYPKMTVKGIEKVGANDTYVVVAAPENNLPPETFYFDVKSGHLLRQDGIVITPEGKTPTKTIFEDVREVDGIKIPFKATTTLPQFDIILTLTEIKHNVKVEDAMFAKPKS